MGGNGSAARGLPYHATCGVQQMPKPAKILVVEDQVLLLLDLVDQLAECGFDSLPLTTADGAAESLLRTRIDGLVTDIDLPGTLSGLDLARRCAEIQPGLPIVVVSGGHHPRAEELPPGAVFLSKPYRLEDIVAGLTAPARTRVCAA